MITVIIILSAIVVIGLIVFIHEFGHFIVAKLFGIGVEKFSIGYPPTMVSHKIGETEYCIGWVPLGGYVKLVGENPELADDDNPKSFLKKSPLVRMAVLGAGPTMNILLGILLLWLVLAFVGESVPKYDTPRIGSVIPGMPASKAGIEPQDLFLFVDGDTVKNWDEMAALIHGKPDQTIAITVQRGDSIFNVQCTPQPRQVTLETGDTVFGMIGIVPTTEQHPIGLVDATWRSIYASVGIVAAVMSFLWKLILGHASMSEVGGPVMIAQMAGDSARMGIWQFLIFIAALSINLAILNLIPIPILDGGQMLFALIEGIRKKALSAKVVAAFQQASIVFLLAIMLLVTIKDILRFF